MLWLLLVVVTLGSVAWVFKGRAQVPQVAGGVGGLSRVGEPQGAPSEREHWLIDPSGRAHHMGQRIVTLGRSANNFVQINDREVSRVHCQLRPSARGVVLVDMTSNNGTFVNHQRVRGERLLRDGDVIKMGGGRLRYCARGRYQDQALRSAKVARAETFKETAQVGRDDAMALVRDVLDDFGGDLYLSAVALGMKAENLRSLCERHRISYKS
jgi:hypothetical protein